MNARHIRLRDHEAFAQRVYRVQRHEWMQRQADQKRQAYPFTPFDSNHDQQNNRYYGVPNVSRVSNTRLVGFVILVAISIHMIMYVGRMNERRLAQVIDAQHSRRLNRTYRDIRHEVMEDNQANVARIMKRSAQEK